MIDTDRPVTETQRALNQIHAARRAGQTSTTISLCPLRRSAAEFNLRRAGYNVQDWGIDPVMTVISWNGFERI